MKQEGKSQRPNFQIGSSICLSEILHIQVKLQFSLQKTIKNKQSPKYNTLINSA